MYDSYAFFIATLQCCVLGALLKVGRHPLSGGAESDKWNRVLAQCYDTSAMDWLYIYCLLTLLSVLSLCQSQSAVDCSTEGKVRTTTQRLKRDILCGYDRSLRPVPEHSNRTTVNLAIAPRIIQFRDETSTFHLKTWLSMNWKDHLLSWKKEDYSNIEQFALDTNMIWIPDISVYNSMDDTPLDRHPSPAIVDSSGQVYVFLSESLTGHCLPDWSNWPYDVNTCNITLGSRKYYGSTVDFTLARRDGLFLNYYLKSNDWELVRATSYRNETPIGPKNLTDGMFLVTISYTFYLRRHASVYVATNIIPGLVVAVISLALLWLPAERLERVAFLCTLVIMKAFYMQYLGYLIPSNGDKTPYLVCFYRDCMLLTGLLIVETVVVRAMTSSTSCPPRFVLTTFRFINSNRFLQYIYGINLDSKYYQAILLLSLLGITRSARMLESDNDEGSALVEGGEGARQWALFTIVLDRTLFLLMVPVYLLLSVSLLPLGYTFSIQ